MGFLQIKDSPSRNVNMKKMNPESSEEVSVESYCKPDNAPPDPTGDVPNGQDVTPDNFSDGSGIGIRILKCVTIGSTSKIFTVNNLRRSILRKYYIFQNVITMMTVRREMSVTRKTELVVS